MHSRGYRSGIGRPHSEDVNGGVQVKTRTARTALEQHAGMSEERGEKQAIVIHLSTSILKTFICAETSYTETWFEPYTGLATKVSSGYYRIRKNGSWQ